MKALKLGAIFAFLVAGIILILNWDSIFGNKKVDPDFIDEDVLDISEECDKVSSAWAHATSWDQELYNSQRADINQSKEMKLFSAEGYETVSSRIREEAINKAYEAYRAALSLENFHHTKLQEAFADMKSLVACVNADYNMQVEKSDVSRVVKVYGINDLYLKVNSFINQKHKIVASFDKEKKKWTSFSAHQNSILSKAEAYRKNKYFAEIKHLPGFSEGLDETYLTNLTNAQRKRFYESLSEQIIAHFESIQPFTQQDLEDYDRVYDEYVDQDGNSREISASLNKKRRNDGKDNLQNQVVEF